MLSKYGIFQVGRFCQIKRYVPINHCWCQKSFFVLLERTLTCKQTDKQNYDSHDRASIASRGKNEAMFIFPLPLIFESFYSLGRSRNSAQKYIAYHFILCLLHFSDAVDHAQKHTKEAELWGMQVDP